LVAGRSPKIKWIVTIALLVILALTHSIWMAWMGGFLVNAGQPFHADIIVVLGGDSYGHRILKAAELVKQGFAPRVLVSGPPGFYGFHENDLAIPFAVKHGYPAEWFVPFPHLGHSTDEEARAILAELRARRVHRMILVTSDFHSRRALRTFRGLGPDIEMGMVTAPDEFFTADGWWRSREGRKTFFMEWSKTFASLVGL
jgi:uncharacterized SAM-binding protein YcdF (DUF218 family)